MQHGHAPSGLLFFKAVVAEIVTGGLKVSDTFMGRVQHFSMALKSW